MRGGYDIKSTEIHVTPQVERLKHLDKLGEVRIKSEPSINAMLYKNNW